MNKQNIFTGIIIALSLLSAVYLFNQQSKYDNENLTFESWKAQYGITYDHSENFYRRAIFQKNVMIIQAHNADSKQTYKMGINQFTGLSDSQFIANYLGAIPPSTEVINQDLKTIYQNQYPNGDIDWVIQGKVSLVKNQGNCGSCWAFSTTGTLQSWSLINGNSVNLSQQQLVDCTAGQGNLGCNGGWPTWALKHVQAKGIASQAEYPYKAITQNCQRDGGYFKISSQVSASGVTALQNAIMKQPVSVTVDASNWSRYSSGVFSNCGQNINHAVLLVGLINNVWKIKNSWGAGWGQSGYIRLSPGATCGIHLYPGVFPA